MTAPLSTSALLATPSTVWRDVQDPWAPSMGDLVIQSRVTTMPAVKPRLDMELRRKRFPLAPTQ